MSSTLPKGPEAIPAWEGLREFELPWDRLLYCFEGAYRCQMTPEEFYFCRFDADLLREALQALAPGFSFPVPDSWSVSGYADLAELQRHAGVIADRLSAFSVRVVGTPRTDQRSS